MRVVAKVAVVSDAPTASQALSRVLQEVDFWQALEARQNSLHLAAGEMRILIKPDMCFFRQDAPTGTDPALVEQLIDLLAEKGYTNCIVADSLQEADLWLENREVLSLADLVGYQFVTPGGQDYDIVSLSEDTVSVDLPDNHFLAPLELSTYWTNAHFCINFAKNKSDEADGYALALHNALGILPLIAKGYHYHHRLRAAEVAEYLLREQPFDFTLIDAWVSNHGSQGMRHARPLPTRTIIASPELLLADWIAATKMGIDPYISTLHTYALRHTGLPEKYTILGDLTPYPDWQSPSIYLRQSTQLRDQSPALCQLSRAWLYEVDTDLFPFKQVIDEQVNSWATKLFHDIEAHPLSASTLISFNYLLGNLHQMVQAWQTLYDKDQLLRQSTALGFDPTAYTADEYVAIPHYILPLAHIVAHSPPDSNGLRWRYIDESVLFEYRKIVPFPYEEFVARVDITQAVTMMYDNIGGQRVTVAHDHHGRILYQAERDLYLPQPNWMVLFGGSLIDVGKIEYLDYGEAAQAIYWRQVDSQNQSARFDDGMVQFSRSGQYTEIKIVARQQFALPLFWQVVNMDYLPLVKDRLVSDAYVRFFSRTMANYEAAYAGRQPLVGRESDKAYGTDAQHDFPVGVTQIKELLAMFSGLAQQLLHSAKPRDSFTVQVDEQGYQHFSPANGATTDVLPLTQIVHELKEALQKDWDYYRQSR